MNGDAVKEIESLTDQARTVEIDGKIYSAKNLERVIHDPQPPTLGMETLQSLADYLNGNLDAVEKEKLFVMVDSFSTVSVLERLNLETMKRKRYIAASLPKLETFPFGQFIPHEDFIIKLRSLFQEKDARNSIIAYVSSISDG